MSNHFSRVTIENFKSIQKIDFACKKINLFIGEPNVGKSNILEALSIFSAPFSFANKKPGSNGVNYYFGWDQIRYNNLKNLFYFQDTSRPISVNTDKGIGKLQLTIPQHELYEFFIAATEEQLDSFSPKRIDQPLNKNSYEFFKASLPDFLPNYYMSVTKDGQYSNAGHDTRMLNYPGFVKKYAFNETLFKNDEGHSRFPEFLLPSFGSNVFTIVQGNHELADLVAGFFEKYNLQFIFIQEKSEYVIQRMLGRIGYQLPYDSVSDTLQRIIFHLAAIYSNKDSVLIFEEPEAHTFPAYITKIAQEIIDSETNQFFISSHSPYLVEEIIEKAPEEDVAVFACLYKNHQTVVHELSSEELSDMKKYKFDIIYNIASLEE